MMTKFPFTAMSAHAASSRARSASTVVISGPESRDTRSPSPSRSPEFHDLVGLS